MRRMHLGGVVGISMVLSKGVGGLETSQHYLDVVSRGIL